MLNLVDACMTLSPPAVIPCRCRSYRAILISHNDLAVSPDPLSGLRLNP